MGVKPIVKKNSTSSVVLDFEPKEFPLIVHAPADDFVNQQSAEFNDFQISELVAEQVGINELKKQKI